MYSFLRHLKLGPLANWTNSKLLGNLELSNFRQISLVNKTSNALFLAKHKHMKTVNKGKLKPRSQRKSLKYMFFLLIVYWNTIYFFHLPLLFPSQKKKKAFHFQSWEVNRNDKMTRVDRLYLSNFPVPLSGFVSLKPTFPCCPLPSVPYEHFIFAHLPSWISIRRLKSRRGASIGNHLWI